MALALALIAAACGDDGGDDVATPRTTDTAPPEQSTTLPADTPVDEGDDDDGETEPASLTASEVGVTESAIRIGVVMPDTSFLERDPGDIEAKSQVIVDEINAAGGINGRTIELYFRPVHPLEDDTYDLACVELVEDVRVFAVLGLFPRSTADCYARINDTPVVNTFAITEADLENFTAPAISLIGQPARLAGERVRTLIDAGALSPDTPIAVHGVNIGLDQHQDYLDALDAAGIEVVADTIGTEDGQDFLALENELLTLSEVWLSSGAEALFASSDLNAQSFVIAYNLTTIDLPMVLPDGVSVPPSLLADALGLDLAPFELATALVDGEDAVTKYEQGIHGVTACVDRFQQSSGEVVALDGSRDNLEETIIACQLFDMFVPIAEAAGVDLTHESFVAAAEAFGPIEITDIAAASIGPGKLDLNDSVGVVGAFNAESVDFEPVA
ncbi:MAG: ABC transporter substrate-binding protein [Actinomycetota bacterium]